VVFVFANCALDLDRRELRRDGVVQHVEPQVFDLLAYLVSHRERVVRRDDLFDTVWHGRDVSDAVLSTRIHAARRAIGDLGRDKQLIRTIYGIGVRFVGEVNQEPGPADAYAAAEPEGPGVIVTALARTGSRPAPLFEAFVEELIAALLQAPWISVVLQPHPAARYSLDGSMRQSQDTLRLMVRLVLNASGRTAWCSRFVGRAHETFELQKRAAAQIATELARELYSIESLRVGAMAGLRLTTWESTVRALSLMNLRTRRSVRAARSVLQAAARADPGCSAIASLISFLATLSVHMGWERHESVIPAAVHTASQASLLNPDDAWSRLALGYAKIYEHPDEAIPLLQQAVRLDPTLSIGHYLLALSSIYAGHCEGAVEHADLAERFSAFDLLARGNLGVYNNVRSTTCFVKGDYAKGVEFARLALAENPMLVPAHRGLVINLALSGRVDEAGEALDRLRRLVPGVSHRWIRETSGSVWARAADRRTYYEAFSIAGLR
jgi:DNA-binding winged helix-turn-helix (wHTH) protein/tetratricopeptide (TPR) repeat protein